MNQPKKIYFSSKFGYAILALGLITATLYICYNQIEIDKLATIVIVALSLSLGIFFFPAITIKSDSICFKNNASIPFDKIKKIQAYPQKRKIVIIYEGPFKKESKCPLYLALYNTTIEEILSYIPKKISIEYITASPDIQ